MAFLCVLIFSYFFKHTESVGLTIRKHKKHKKITIAQ